MKLCTIVQWNLQESNERPPSAWHKLETAITQPVARNPLSQDATYNGKCFKNQTTIFCSWALDTLNMLNNFIIFLESLTQGVYPAQPSIDIQGTKVSSSMPMTCSNHLLFSIGNRYNCITCLKRPPLLPQQSQYRCSLEPAWVSCRTVVPAI